MIHIGSPTYYQDIHSRLTPCDIILFEAVRSPRVAILTLAYRILARRKRLGLVTQNSALPLSGLSAKLIHGDVSAEQFGEAWSHVPWLWRAALYVGAPLFGVYLYLTATRRSLGKHLSKEDLPSRKEAMSEEQMPGVQEAIVHARDRKIIESIREILQNEVAGNSLVGIVYGAGHMSAITTALMGGLRYRVTKAEWLSVFEYDDA